MVKNREYLVMASNVNPGGELMNITSRCSMGAVLTIAFMAFVVWSSGVSARMEFGNLEVSGEIFVLAEGQWNSGSNDPSEFAITPDGAPGLFLGPGQIGVTSTYGTPNRNRWDSVTALRTELLIELVYKGIPRITPVVRLRPFYDAMFDINNKTGSASEAWETNVRGGLNDRWDPLVREAYLDLNFHPIYARVGRQIVTWGRSDGVTVLDVVTPRNFRNPLTFEQERFMIPQWMINMKFDLGRLDWVPGGIQKELQIVWNLDYRPAYFPGINNKEEGSHPWTLGVVDFANQIVNVSEGLFPAEAGFGEFFDGDKYREGDAFDKSEVFVRWKGRTSPDAIPLLSDMTYSFHYAYLFEDVPFYELRGRANFGFAFPFATARAFGGGIDLARHRYQLVGFSFDKALLFLPGQFQGTVMRGEMAYNIGNKFYEGDFATHEANQLQTLIGFDQFLYFGPKSFIKTPWFTSFQWWRDEVLRDPGPGVSTRLLSDACARQPHCGREGYVIGGEGNMFTGMRKRTRDVITLFMFNEFLPGRTVRVELFGLHELGGWQRSTWMRGVLGYSFSGRVTGRVGINVIQGQKEAFFGQFKKTSSAFAELKFTF